MEQQGSTSCVWPCQDSSAPYYYFTDHTCKSFCSDPYQALKNPYGTSCELVLSESQEKEVKAVVSINNAGAVLNTLSTSAAVIISPASTAVVTGSTLVKILGFVRYLDVSHSATLEAVFADFKAATGVLDFKQLQLYADKKFSYKTPPKVFEKYNISPVFLLGFWIGVVSLLVICFIVLIIAALYRKCSNRYKDSKHKPIFRKIKITAQNFLLQQLYASYGDITLYGVLQFRSTELSRAESVVSLLIAIAFLGIIISVLVAHARFLRRYQQIKKELTKSSEKGLAKLDQFRDHHQGVKTLFEAFKDTSFTHQAFLLFFIIRSVITALCLSTLFKHPLAQAIILISISISLLIYLLMFRPFKNLADNLQQITFELLILTANICLLIIAILDKQDGDHTYTKNRAAQAILIVNAISHYAPLACIVLKVLLIIYEKYQSKKAAERAKNMNDAGDVGMKASDAKEAEIEPKALQTSMINLAIETSPDLAKAHMYEEDRDNESPKTSKKLLNHAADDTSCMSPIGLSANPTPRGENSPFLGGISPKKAKNWNAASGCAEMAVVDENADKNEESKEDQGDKNKENIIMEIPEDSIQYFDGIKMTESPTHKNIAQNKKSHKDEFEEDLTLNDSGNMDKSPIYISNLSPNFLNSPVMLGSAKKDVEKQS